LRLRLCQFGVDFSDEPRVARQAEQKIDAVGLTEVDPIRRTTDRSY
jgi:hypothetical protein